MLVYPPIDPVAFHIASWPVYWYGLMYLIGFLAGWGLLALRTHYSPRGFTHDQVADVAFYAVIGAIVGGRLGYMLFYDWQAWVSHPWLIFQTWKGGMSFHGGFLGVMVAMCLFTRKVHKPFLVLTDFIVPVVPIGLGAGRIGNFINGELWGRVTDMPWGMLFPYGGPLPRHPSQLYEFGMEGILLFFIIFIYSWKPRPLGAVSGLFALTYGVFRFIVEFFREPDAQVGYLFGWVTEGQLLSLPMIALGIVLLLSAYKRSLVPHPGPLAADGCCEHRNQTVRAVDKVEKEE